MEAETKKQGKGCSPLLHQSQQNSQALLNVDALAGFLGNGKAPLNVKKMTKSTLSALAAAGQKDA